MASFQMWFWIVVTATLAFAQTAGFAVITKPVTNEAVPAGSTYKIVWTPGSATGKVALSLIGGATPATLNNVGDIAAGVDVKAGTFDWAVPSDLGSLAVYGIRIASEDDPSIFQFSFPFQIKNADGKTASASTASKTTSTVSTAPTKSTTQTGSISTASSKTATTTKTNSVTSSESSTATSTGTESSTATSATSTPTSGSSTQNPPTSQPLGTPVIIGLAVGGAALLAILAGVAQYFIRRRRKEAMELDKREYQSLIELEHQQLHMGGGEYHPPHMSGHPHMDNTHHMHMDRGRY